MLNLTSLLALKISTKKKIMDVAVALKSSQGKNSHVPAKEGNLERVAYSVTAICVDVALVEILTEN